MKYAHIQQLPRGSLTTRLRALSVSHSGYHAWRTRAESVRAQADRQLLCEIKRIHAVHREVYGAIKTWHTLNHNGMACGKHRVARLRREAGIEAKRRRHFRSMVEHHKTDAPAPDLLQRQFTVTQPDRVWSSDMTFIRTREGWLYLTVLLDLFSRRVVGWAMHPKPGQGLHMSALHMALLQRRPAPGLIHHSDRGSQYHTRAYKQMMGAHDVIPSMNGSQRPQDNAVAESFFSNLKNELVHHCDFSTRDEARAAIFDYIEIFYNRQRLHQTLNYQTPVAVETAYFEGQCER